MANNQPMDGDEIDLFDVIETLWDGRVILAGFVVAAMAIGAMFLLSTNRNMSQKQDMRLIRTAFP